tara:strand:- start:10163 stop:10654 length:492 start_codon:yes stop_codon:yes gene_type:complete
MAKKLNGETYEGTAISVPISQDGQVAAYVWPLRILTVQRDTGPMTMGGPTIGVDVGMEEVLRFDCHGKPGHWHRGGYDRLEKPGNSHVDFPDQIEDVQNQIDWSLETILNDCSSLLKEALHDDAASKVEPSMLVDAVEQIKQQLAVSHALRQRAIDGNVINLY